MKTLRRLCSVHGIIGLGLSLLPSLAVGCVDPGQEDEPEQTDGGDGSDSPEPGGSGSEASGSGEDGADDSGDDDDDDDDTGPSATVDLALTVINSGVSEGAMAMNQFRMRGEGTHAGPPGVERSLDPDDYRAGSIASGAPGSMTLYLRSIRLLAEEANDALLYESEEPAGTALALSNGELDLSSLDLSMAEVAPGDYSGIRLEFGRVAEISGCVTTSFAAATGTTAEIDDSGDSPHGGNEYTSETISEGEHTFCTVTERSVIEVDPFSEDSVGSNADYAAVSDPTPVEIDLELSNEDALVGDDLRALSTQVDQDLAFTLVADEAVELTVAIDLNRMLRFYANTRTDFNPPNPMMKTGTSYFFSTVFGSSLSAFVGRPGSIEGYQVDVEACAGDGNEGPSCTPNLLVKAWMTLIKDADGDVISGLIMPDDDNTLTVFKGSVVTDGIEVTEGGSGGITIPFTLGSDSEASLLDFASVENVGDEGNAQLIPLSRPTETVPVFYRREL